MIYNIQDIEKIESKVYESYVAVYNERKGLNFW